ncbi:MAG: hypothetical protein B6244_07780 [Candidatus Cloacimonetes bacterium 4572_55]|nr:MAG: hypothetical protein B6244_07780 [Candidatus Cloacimonetes bacterium 4572_55]
MGYKRSSGQKNKFFASHAIKFFVFFPFLCSIYWGWQEKEPLAFIGYLFLSIISFLLYYIDKKRAENKQWRISEVALHIWEFLGGWPGALIAQQKIRHKNKKRSYQIVFWLIVSAHIGFWSYSLFVDATAMRMFFQVIRKFVDLATF